MTFYDFLQLIGGIILALGYIPQICQLLRTKSCGDLNLKTYLYLTLGIGMMEIYAIDLYKNGNGHMFLVTNSISFALVALISFLIIKYRLRVPFPGLRTVFGCPNGLRSGKKWPDPASPEQKLPHPRPSGNSPEK